jgi:hypothetical protein
MSAGRIVLESQYVGTACLTCGRDLRMVAGWQAPLPVVAGRPLAENHRLYRCEIGHAYLETIGKDFDSLSRAPLYDQLEGGGDAA